MDVWIRTKDNRTDKADIFNALSAMGYVYLQQKKYGLAKEYIQKALDIYPKNIYLIDLLQ